MYKETHLFFFSFFSLEGGTPWDAGVGAGSEPAPDPTGVGLSFGSWPLTSVVVSLASDPPGPRAQSSSSSRLRRGNISVATNEGELIGYISCSSENMGAASAGAMLRTTAATRMGVETWTMMKFLRKLTI
jgi:hypothetical protein